MNHITPFQFENSSIRVVIDENGEPLFVGKDICDALGYADHTNAMKQHCKGVVKRHPLSTPGGVQELRVISEPDVMRLMTNSTLPAAESFERLVFEEILPTIRKTGSYQATTERQPKSRPATSLDSMRKQRAIELAISNADALRDRFPTIGEKALQCVYSTLVNDAAGALVLPAPSLGHVKPLSATEAGKILGVSANMIGRVATANNVKTEEHGEWILGTAESNPSQRPTFVYNQAGVEKLRSLFVSANDIDGCAA